MGKEIISKVREELGEDSSKVETFLKEIENDYKEFQDKIDDQRDTISTVNTESKGRKLEIRKLKSELDDANDEMETLKGEDKSEEVESLKEKVKGYEDAEAEKVKIKAKGFIDKYDKLKDHTDWEKSKDKFKIPDEKDGELDWKSLKDNDIAKNADKLSEYQGIGLLGEANPKSEERGQARGAETDSGVFKDTDFE